METKKQSTGAFADDYGKDFVDDFTDRTNRSVWQTEFLYKLVDKDLEKLVELEEKLKNNHCSFCPGDKEKVEEVLNMGYGSYWWKM